MHLFPYTVRPEPVEGASLGPQAHHERVWGKPGCTCSPIPFVLSLSKDASLGLRLFRSVMRPPPLEAFLRRDDLRRRPSVAAGAQRGAKRPDVLDPQVAVEARRDLAELLGQREAAGSGGGADLAAHPHAPAGRRPPRDPAVGPAPRRPREVARNRQRAAAAALR